MAGCREGAVTPFRPLLRCAVQRQHCKKRSFLPWIHVEGNGGAMKVWLVTCQVEFAAGLSASEQRKVMETVRENRDLFLEKWNEFARRKK
jgi:hypothetical protein